MQWAIGDNHVKPFPCASRAGLNRGACQAMVHVIQHGRRGMKPAALAKCASQGGTDPYERSQRGDVNGDCSCLLRHHGHGRHQQHQQHQHYHHAQMKQPLPVPLTRGEVAHHAAAQHSTFRSFCTARRFFFLFLGGGQ